MGGLGRCIAPPDTNLKRQVAIKVLPVSIGGVHGLERAEWTERPYGSVMNRMKRRRFDAHAMLARQNVQHTHLPLPLLARMGVESAGGQWDCGDLVVTGSKTGSLLRTLSGTWNRSRKCCASCPLTSGSGHAVSRMRGIRCAETQWSNRNVGLREFARTNG